MANPNCDEDEIERMWLAMNSDAGRKVEPYDAFRARVRKWDEWPKFAPSPYPRRFALDGDTFKEVAERGVDDILASEPNPDYKDAKP